jgi:hypothetical protein
MDLGLDGHRFLTPSPYKSTVTHFMRFRKLSPFMCRFDSQIQQEAFTTKATSRDWNGFLPVLNHSCPSTSTGSNFRYNLRRQVPTLKFMPVFGPEQWLL